MSIIPNPIVTTKTSNKTNKRYLLFLYSLNRDSEEKIKLIEKIIQTSLKDFILVRLEDPEEALKVIVVKNIELIILDSSLFGNPETSIEFAQQCKKRRRSPILFVTNNPSNLVKLYREKMFVYQEFDNYFSEPIDPVELKKKVAQVTQAKARTAKRFSFDAPVKLYRLNDSLDYNMTLIDISLVGFGVKNENADIFDINEQVKVKIPLYPFKIFHPEFGEYINLAGKLRRMSMSGQELGFSIEFVTAAQTETLFEVLGVINSKLKMKPFAEKGLASAFFPPKSS